MSGPINSSTSPNTLKLTVGGTEPDPAEDSIRKRVQEAFDKVAEGKTKLTEKFSECRWGLVESGGFSVVIVSSLGTGASYMIDRQTAGFYRTLSPSVKRIMGANPRETIKQDRDWLFPLLSGGALPGGKECLARYRPGSYDEAEAAPAPTPGAVDPALKNLFLGLKPGKTHKKIVITETTQFLDFRSDQIAALLATVNVPVPAGATFVVTDNGYLRMSWTDTKETEE